MRQVDPALAEAIESSEREPLVRLSVDWDRDGHGPRGSIDDLSGRVAAVTVTRALVGELPESVSLVEGSAAAAVEVELARGFSDDERKHAAWYFSRFNTASPLAGKERLARRVALDVGFATRNGPRYLRTLTGSTRALPVDVRARTARLFALDGRERMRTGVLLPPVDGDVAGLNAAWLVSYALHKCGIAVSPRPQAGCRLWMPMHGSTRAMLGGLDALWTQPHLTGTETRGTAVSAATPEFVGGPFSLAAHAAIHSATDHDTLTGDLAFAPGRSLYAKDGSSGRFELWVRGDPTPAAVANTVLQFTLDSANAPPVHPHLKMGIRPNRRLYFDVNDGTFAGPVDSGRTLPADGRWHFVGFAWQLNPTGNALFKFKVDNFDEGWFVGYTNAKLPGTDVWSTPPNLTTYLPIAEVHITGGPAIPADVPWLGDVPFTPAATVDRSALDLVLVAEPDPIEAWQLVSELAAAEQAVAYFDEDGQFRYRSRDRLNDDAARLVQRTLTAEATILDLHYDDRIDAVRNVVRVGYTDQRTTNTNVWQRSDTHRLAPRASLTFFATVSAPLLDLDTQVTLWHPADTTPLPDVNTYISPNTTPIGAGAKAGLVAGVVDYWDAGTVKLTITNHSPTATAYLRNTAGKPTLRLAGRAVTRTDGAVEARDPASIAEFGEQPLPIPASRWVQRRTVAATLATALVADLATAKAVITDLEIIADPRLQLGDRIRLIDRDGLALDGEYWITSITDRLTTDGGYTQRLTARRAT